MPTNDQLYETNARLRKALPLTVALTLRCATDLTRPDLLDDLTDATWREIAQQAGVREPSLLTRRIVIDAVRGYYERSVR